MERVKQRNMEQNPLRKEAESEDVMSAAEKLHCVRNSQADVASANGGDVNSCLDDVREFFNLSLSVMCTRLHDLLSTNIASPQTAATGTSSDDTILKLVCVGFQPSIQ